MSRACPLRKKTALEIVIDISLLHLRSFLREEEVHEREEAAECIPHSCIGKHVTRADLAGVRAVMHPLAFCINL